ncbi:Ger(x)C family spore germination protein [Paenibacillus riograndensis]|uniref:Putative secreted protein n=1 Tax=Paenibacillus riograndensis SBR5 TaxID=1073571 RepID=A0A0E3WG90_9BACL|nr:Ger(x)C family spore germination protein [Paenibacillus riograndensis]CQR52191.1 putative secreted protein [Paenibacillus riograndensis SBR5]
MRAAPRLLPLLLCIVMLPCLSGCWNYTEVDDISIVAGVAIDKDGANEKIQLTAEMVDIQGGLDQNQAGFKMLSLTGSTIFDIVRNMISITGKKLFWSHAKAIIFSEKVAREGLIRTVDWYSRDTETRSDVFIFVSGEPTAREILNLNSTTKTIMSFELAQMMRDEKYTSSAPTVEIWDFIDKLETMGNHAVAPLIYIHEQNGQKNERVNGCAIFSKDKMVGKLNGKETKSMLFAKDGIKGGVLGVNDKNGVPTYSLEILSSRTKVKPRVVNGKLLLQVRTVTHTGLDEVMTSESFSGNETISAIEERAGEALEQEILAVIRKMQREYHADIFGYGEIIHEHQPEMWVKVRDRWDDEFAKLDITVDSKVIIESTAKTSRSIKMGD